VWNLNQEIQLAGHTLTLVSITADSRSGYSFHFQVDPKVYSASVQIAGYTPNGGGGGGGGGLTNGEFNISLSYTQLPSGVLTVNVSDLTLIGDSIIWEEQWSPATPRTDLPANPTPQPGLCLTADSLVQLQPAPSTMANGKALIYEKLDTGTWGLVLYNLDGSQKQVVVPNGNWGALSPDGSQVAYSASDNKIHIIDLASQTEKVLPDAGGFNLHWSPDGKQIAYVGMGDGVVNSVFVITTDSTLARQISNLSYGLVIGWSPDGKLYFAAPYTGGAAWKVYSYDLASSAVQERFTIENGTPKFLNPKLSPDGNWIAYRGRDNSSLYLVHPDGSDMRLVLDNAGVAGIEWSRSGWLGVSLRKANSDESTVVLIKPDGCEKYQLPTVLHGDLEGLFIP
jgi:WD40 repeat protein